MTELHAVVTTEDGLVVDEANRVADQLAATAAARPEVVAVCLDGVADPALAADRRPDTVLSVDRPDGKFERGSAGVSARVAALATLVSERQPIAVLSASETDDEDVAAALAARIGCGVVTDAVLQVRDGDLTAGRPAYGGRAFAELEFETEPAVAALDADILVQRTPDDGESAEEQVTVECDDEPRIERRAVLEVPEQDLTRADRVVAGGAGLGDPAGFDLVDDLADAMRAAVGASRPPADDGWVPYDRQIGVTGAEIDVDLYVPLAISGDPYHTRSVTADHLVAINEDPEARIFEFANLGVVGDVYEVGPALRDAIASSSAAEAEVER